MAVFTHVRLCGFFRVLRGVNHLGIETAAAHTYVAGWSPPEDLIRDLATSSCFDDASWNDGFGNSCAWYAVHDPGCTKFQDYGQLSLCKSSCKRCPLSSSKDLPSTSLEEAVARATSAARKNSSRAWRSLLFLSAAVILLSSCHVLGT
eukprot:TRINITY_DN25961_c0_g1_i1.p1 TRINITY_DN25961_c0_g1~~TRINITY_DN25961_c0_g1_i1.p1  ORF type:complete len:148 (+),score=14.14 TRINITY_DN25961_c0_g1_i1:73-516(+)